ncbi:MAG: 50S ribosomal protein L31 [Candidatus Margulisiibacteriota bacterium]|jgi:large subunit ribosomal protein L31
MKDKIHPKYFQTKASCACGATYDVGSTKDSLRVDICSACHPLFTGKEKMMDIEGRVQKFQKKYAGVTPKAKKPAAKKKSAAAKKSPAKKK